MTRAEALAVAIDHVNKLYPPVNARGYADGAAPLEARGALILQFAEFLMLSDRTNPNAVGPNTGPEF